MPGACRTVSAMARPLAVRSPRSAVMVRRAPLTTAVGTAKAGTRNANWSRAAVVGGAVVGGFVFGASYANATSIKALLEQISSRLDVRVCKPRSSPGIPP